MGEIHQNFTFTFLSKFYLKPCHASLPFHAMSQPSSCTTTPLNLKSNTIISISIQQRAIQGAEDGGR